MLNYLAAYALIQKRLSQCEELFVSSVDETLNEKSVTGADALIPALKCLDQELISISSKIEQLMFGILIGIQVPEYGLFYETTQNGTCYEIHDGSSPYDAIVIDRQVLVKPYTLDFMITFFANNKFHNVGIECDGHDFHEKTKAQAARDKKRDRGLATQGIVVLRFTGSEIWRDPIKVQAEITDYIKSIIEPK